MYGWYNDITNDGHAILQARAPTGRLAHTALPTLIHTATSVGHRALTLAPRRRPRFKLGLRAHTSECRRWRSWLFLHLALEAAQRSTQYQSSSASPRRLSPPGQAHIIRKAPVTSYEGRYIRLSHQLRRALYASRDGGIGAESGADGVRRLGGDSTACGGRRGYRRVDDRSKSSSSCCCEPHGH